MPIYRKVNQDFFKIWSDEMAYILGFLFADGNIVKTKRGNNYLSIYTSDYGLLYEIRKFLGSDHIISKRNVITCGSVYRVQIGSKEIFKDLGFLGLTPNKAKRMKFPNIPHIYVGDFIRGYFDGDGNVWMGEINKNRRIPTQMIQTAFTSGSKYFLENLKKVLFDLGVKKGRFLKLKTRIAIVFHIAMRIL